MLRFFTAALALVALLLPSLAHAEPADIEAAARGVVRVVVIGRDGTEIFPVSHGTGWAVGPETIVTNAHVVSDAKLDETLAVGIVPSDGDEAVYARIGAISVRNDLAILTTTTPLRLPPLTLSGIAPGGSGSVFAIGYPMNVDRAQGLEIQDIFRAQPPVTSQGFLSGRRPSREMDTLLHTAPIAAGNSGGPLVDECGRVIGVNSFGAESAGTDAEFFFAVSVREILPFLRANDVTPQINSMPCRSLADLEADERARAEAAAEAEKERSAAEEATLSARRAELRRGVEFAIMDERENRMGLAFFALLLSLGAGGFAWMFHERREMRGRAIAGSIAVLALVAALVSWLSRPAFAEVEDRLEDQLRTEMGESDSGTITPPVTQAGALTCVLDTERSRVVGQPITDIPLSWKGDGCVNERTQYGSADGRWQRVFVPGDEATVSVNTYDPASATFTTERYLLDRDAMTKARQARADYEAPSCDAESGAARDLGDRQANVLALLPQRPNERLVYRCTASAENPGSEMQDSLK